MTTRRNTALEKGRVHRLDDLPQGDGIGGTGEKVASGLSAAAVNEAAAPQIVQNLHKKVAGDGFTLCHLVKPCKTPPVMDLRELSESPACVFQFL